MPLRKPTTAAAGGGLTEPVTFTQVITSSVASGSNAVLLGTGARFKLGGGTTDYLTSDGSTTITAAGAFTVTGVLTSSVASGSNWTAITTGARLKLGGGTTDYFVSDGSTLITAAGGLAASTLAATSVTLSAASSANAIVISNDGAFLKGGTHATGTVSWNNTGRMTVGGTLLTVAGVTVGTALSAGTTVTAATDLISTGGKLILDFTDSTGTPGAATINKAAGKSSIAAAATSVVITNNKVTTSSRIHITPLLIDATVAKFQAVPASGSFTVTVDAAATANWPFCWMVEG